MIQQGWGDSLSFSLSHSLSLSLSAQQTCHCAQNGRQPTVNLLQIWAASTQALRSPVGSLAKTARQYRGEAARCHLDRVQELDERLVHAVVPAFQSQQAALRVQG